MTSDYVRLEGVTKRFGDFTAVAEVSLAVRKGEIFCLLGGSGCGKTTLLRMLAGLEAPTSGRIVIDDIDMTGIPAYARPVNMMFQSYALFPHLTVERNLAFGLEQEKLPQAEIATRVADMLGIVKMAEFARRKPHQLSGGQRQRVALARALVKRPKLLLLDEPLGALDRRLREHTQFELLNIQQQLGVTFIVVTHDQEEAMTLAGRIGVMDRGVIIQVGTPREVYEFPASKLVAEFVGVVNMFEGVVLSAAADGTSIRSPELDAPLRVSQDAALTLGSRAWVAIRPEQIRVARAVAAASADSPAAAASENSARGVVREVAFLGDVSTLIVEIASGKRVRVSRPNTVRDAAENLARHDLVDLSWHPMSPVVLTR